MLRSPWVALRPDNSEAIQPTNCCCLTMSHLGRNAVSPATSWPVARLVIPVGAIARSKDCLCRFILTSNCDRSDVLDARRWPVNSPAAGRHFHTVLITFAIPMENCDPSKALASLEKARLVVDWRQSPSIDNPSNLVTESVQKVSD